MYTKLPVLHMEMQGLGAVLFLLLSFFKDASEKNKFAYKLIFFINLFKICVLDFSLYINSFKIGLLAAVIFVLALEKLYKMLSKNERSTLNSVKLVRLIITGIYYGLFYASLAGKTFNFFTLTVNSLNTLIFIRSIRSYKTAESIFFSIITAIFMFLSITDIYTLLKNGRLLTLLWAFYAIAAFIRYLRKRNKKLVYEALFYIIAVAIKPVTVDLYTLSVLSKVITPIVFGFALLLLSYAVQPTIKRFAKPETPENEEE